MSQLGPKFYKKLIQVANNVGLSPEDLLAVMAGESDITSDITNSIQAKGLIQFMPSTLKGLGFTGQDFAKVSAEEQLDYVQKFIQSLGFKFKSAAQYYVGNLLPVALRLPGVQREDPSTIIIEKKPSVIRNPKNPNELLSKKYYDVGVTLTADFENKVFLNNPVFGHGKNYITYKDFQDQINKNKQRTSYKNAIKQLNAVGYSPQETPKPTNTPAQVKDEFDDYVESVSKDTDEFDDYVNSFKTTQPTAQSYDNSSYDTLDNILTKQVYAQKLYSNYLPDNDITIIVNSNNRISSLSFSKILSQTIENNLFCKANIDEGDNVKINIKIAGGEKESFDAILGISNVVRNACSKFNNSINTLCIFNKGK